jgi:hypothetical protein
MNKALLQEEYREIIGIVRQDSFRRASAEEKCDIIWEAVSRVPYETLPPVEVSLVGMYFGILDRRKLKLAFHTEDDVRPPRKKAFHPFGSVAKVRFNTVEGHPYTGLLKSGAVGLARLSLARDYGNYSPSAAFKFFVDGKPSEHVVLDQSIDQQTSRDFFERAPTNITQWPQRGQLKYGWYFINWWLSRIADPLHQYLDNLVSITSDGQPVAEPRAPYRISFYAPPEVHTPPDTTLDFREQLAHIPAGTHLYNVRVTDNREQWGQEHIGTITTESPFVASGFGDHVLSLRHAYQRPAAGAN